MSKNIDNSISDIDSEKNTSDLLKLSSNIKKRKQIEISNEIDKVSISSIETEMKKCYLEYAMSVIVSRAIPDVRDGCKPVQRRILYTLYRMANKNRTYFKSARVVGETMGKYHPHGDSPIYGALVRMAQSFSLSAPLIDGQGNFGSIDGDSPAQMRYTEVRLSKLAYSLLDDIEFNTVDFQENYDGSEIEPKYLAPQFPNVLVNGANGIAVGMATNIPPFNLGEIIDACCSYIDNPNITLEEIIKIVTMPDFPTGGEIVGIDKLNSAMRKGQGIITVRGKTQIESEDGRSSIIIVEIPYQVNKSELVKNIEIASKDKRIDGIVDISDESNKLGIRVVISLRRGTDPEVVLNQIYKYTQMETSFGVNMLVLKDGKPEIMNCLDIITHFIKFREEIVTKRINYLLNKDRDKTHLLVGMMTAIENIDDVIRIVKETKDPNSAKTILISKNWNIADETVDMLNLINDDRNKFNNNFISLTQAQANSILEMRIQRLTGIEIKKINDEVKELIDRIAYYISILQSKEKLLNMIKEELLDIKNKYSVPRRTSISSLATDINEEDLIKQESMVVTITRTGYVKRTHLNSYREQKRGGKGKSGMSTHDDDVITDVIVTTTHHSIMMFSDLGKVYRIKVYKLPLGSPHSKGRALVNLIPLSNNEKINSVLAIGDEYFKSNLIKQNDYLKTSSTNDNIDINSTDDNQYEDKDNEHYFIFATANGYARRNLITDFSNIPNNGKIAIKLDNDRLIGVVLCKKDDHIILATKYGKAIRFPVKAIRVFKGRTSTGVRAVRLVKETDAVVSLCMISVLDVSSDTREIFLRLPVNNRMELNNLIKKNKKQEDKAIYESTLLEIKKLSDNLEKISEKKINALDIIKMVEREKFILTITEKGYAKRSSIYEYRPTGRGVQGVSNMTKRGLVVSAFPVQQNDGIMIITDKGTMIRVSVDNIRITSRNTMGVKVMNLQSNDIICSVSKIIEEDIDFN
ncbi:DNA gyrase subunit A [Lyticum sinuosum]|uniref:DNA topoisomerase (ATP-hydrolyzing) n=1 Tax=Lyticum sinuosum TaxID=1332059 RepID=A0AAE5AGM5_9RICK|nr:DNA gyrase subunit A [Lyticum sinuosum]MDZ5760922.1 DNA gyrase subunit A [Lyticum sinuosum]